MALGGQLRKGESDMKFNVGGLDRIARIVIGGLLVIYALMGHPWAWLGVLALASGLVGFCPAYHLLGFNTCPVKAKD
jgi:hypothetical protein